MTAVPIRAFKLSPSGSGRVFPATRAAPSSVAGGVKTRVKMVSASSGKHVRAEPIAALYEQRRIRHVVPFPALEDQLCAFTSEGYVGEGSPDRADALVWALTEVLLVVENDIEPWIQYAREKVAEWKKQGLVW